MNLRALKKAAAVVLPEAIKRRLRGRLYGFAPPAVDFGLRVATDAQGVPVAEAAGLSLRLIPEAVDDVEFHFRGNGDSVEEMHGFLRAARETGGTLFDVGAHHGLFAAAFCLARPGNRAVAYEPSPVLRGAGERMLALNGLEDRVRYREAGVTRAAGTRPAWVDASKGFISFDPPPPGVQAHDLEMTTLDAECERLGVFPDVVKVDVEGHELEVLRGARELLARKKPVLFLELHLDLLEKAGERPAELVELLAGHGYRFETSLGRPLRPGAVAGSPMALLRCVAR
ncbi:MAG TPA: FkbM family methyltransferase [Longimicrobium sp.]|jgi:FkbM family methyltransferase